MNDNYAEKPKGPVSDLPKTVPLIEGSPNLRASNRSDVMALAERVKKVPAENLYALIGFMNGHGMMLLSSWNFSGFIINRTVKKLAKMYNGDRYVAWMMCLSTMVNADYETVKNATTGKAFLPQSAEALERLKAKGMKTLEGMRSDAVRHILTGKDREERSSVGGFSQREMTAVNNVITLLTAGEPLTVQDLRQKALGLTA